MTGWPCWWPGPGGSAVGSWWGHEPMNSVRVMLSRKKRHWASVDTHRGDSSSLGTLLARARPLSWYGPPIHPEVQSQARGRSGPAPRCTVSPACLMSPVSCHLSSSSVLLSCSLHAALSCCSAKLLLASFQISKQILAKKCWALWVNPGSRDSSCGKQRGAQFDGTGICSA